MYAFLEEGLRRYKALSNTESVRGVRIVSAGYEVDVGSYNSPYNDIPSDVEPS